MKILKSIAVAFSMYSRIPMPRFNWDSDDMKYHLIFFPWVGIVIGILEILWKNISVYLDLKSICFVAISILIPLVVTGGFHVDGYMDVSDALSSYKQQQERLEILKDPHIGAFAVIRLVELGLVLAFSLALMSGRGVYVWAFSFVFSRVLSGISVIKFRKARSGGSLNTEYKTAENTAVLVGLVITGVVGVIVLLVTCGLPGVAVLCAEAIAFIYYWRMSYRNFGGITGDLAGWFVCISEVFTGLVVGVVYYFPI